MSKPTARFFKEPSQLDGWRKASGPVIRLDLMHVYMHGCTYGCMYVCPSVRSVCQSVCPCLNVRCLLHLLSMSLPACLSVCVSVCMTVCQSIPRSGCLPACLPARLSVSVSVSLCLCLCVCLFMFYVYVYVCVFVCNCVRVFLSLCVRHCRKLSSCLLASLCHYLSLYVGRMMQWLVGYDIYLQFAACSASAGRRQEDLLDRKPTKNCIMLEN